MLNLLPHKNFNKQLVLLIVVIIFIISMSLFIFWHLTNKKYEALKKQNVIAMQEAIKNNNKKENSPKNPAIAGINQEANGLLSLSYEQVEVRKLLQQLADINNINLIIHPDVKGFIGLSLRQISWQQAFASILALQNLVEFNKDNVLFVLTENQAKKWQEQQLQLEQMISKVFYIRHRKATDMVELIKKPENQVLTNRAIVLVDNNTNSLIIKEVESNLANITKVIEQLDHSPKQVLISARIVSIDENYVKDLGTQLGVAMKSDTTPDENTVQNEIGVGQLYIAIAKLDDLHVLDLALFALERKGRGKMIAKPRLVTMDRQAAYIQSGQEIPYEEKTASGATNVTFKKAVMSLRITPEMTASKKINLKISVNQDKISSFLVRGVPGIDTQQLETQVVVNDSQTVVLGGIYEEMDQEQTEGIPVISDIPWLGKLFTHRKKNSSRKELLVFITPKVINEAVHGNQANEEYFFSGTDG